MSVLVLTGASGAPGVTTTALGLALAWPRDVVLVDADRSAPHTVLAGYLSGVAPHGLGVQGLLQAHRERRPLDVALEANTLDLPGAPRPKGEQDAVARRFVPGFSHLGSVPLFDGVWAPLLDAVRGADHDLVVDAGRPGHTGLPADLLAGADAVGLVCRSSLVSLAGLRLHLARLLDGGPLRRVGLVLVGPGRPYAAKEVAEQFGVEVFAELAWEPRAAADLVEAGSLPTNWARQALARSYDRAAGALRERMTAGLELEGAA